MPRAIKDAAVQMEDAVVLGRSGRGDSIARMVGDGLAIRVGRAFEQRIEVGGEQSDPSLRVPRQPHQVEMVRNRKTRCRREQLGGRCTYPRGRLGQTYPSFE